MVVNECIWKSMRLYDGIGMHMKACEYKWANKIVYQCKWK